MPESHSRHSSRLPAITKVLAAHRSATTHVTSEDVEAAWAELDAHRGLLAEIDPTIVTLEAARTTIEKLRDALAPFIDAKPLPGAGADRYCLHVPGDAIRAAKAAGRP